MINTSKKTTIYLIKTAVTSNKLKFKTNKHFANSKTMRNKKKNRINQTLLYTHLCEKVIHFLVSSEASRRIYVQVCE